MMIDPTVGEPGQKWVSRFPAYDEANPDIWQYFKQFTFELIKAGRTHASARMVLGRIRFETLVRSHDDPYKINSAFSASYARKFMREFPQHDGLFETRIRAGGDADESC